jgi:phosphatidylserine decarboxylase
LLKGPYRDTKLACYVVQIAARSVNGIDSHVCEGTTVERGAIFGMIRIGSQVDLIVPWRENLHTRVRAGDRARAGETILID